MDSAIPNDFFDEENMNKFGEMYRNKVDKFVDDLEKILHQVVSASRFSEKAEFTLIQTLDDCRRLELDFEALPNIYIRLIQIRYLTKDKKSSSWRLEWCLDANIK